MKCMKCGKQTFASTTSEAIELGFGLLVIRDIPCFKCEECDDVLYTGDVVERIESIIDETKAMMQAVRIVRFNEAA